MTHRSPVIRHEAGHLALMAHHGMTWRSVWVSEAGVASIHDPSAPPTPAAAASVAVAGALAEGYDLSPQRFVRPRRGDPWAGDLAMLRYLVGQRGAALLALVEAGITIAREVLTTAEVDRWAQHIVAEDEARVARIRAMFCAG